MWASLYGTGSTCSSSWSSSLLDKCQLSSHHGFDTIVHILYEVLLGSTESSSVGDIEDAVISFGMLSMDTSDLDVVFVGNGVKCGLVFSEVDEFDVN